MVVEKTVLIGLQDFHLRAGGALPFKQQKSAVTGLYKRIVTHPMQGRVSAESDQRGLHSARERRTQHLHEYATVRQLVRRYTQRSNSLGAEQHSWCARVCVRVCVVSPIQRRPKMSSRAQCRSVHFLPGALSIFCAVLAAIVVAMVMVRTCGRVRTCACKKNRK